MKIAGFLCVALAGIATVVDQVTAQKADFAVSLNSCPNLKEVDLDDRRPFPQPPANTISEKAAVKFKPMLHISNDGCVPYPAPSKSVNYCKGNQHGSQIYGRAAWHNNKYAIVYTWYFPSQYSDFALHGWQTCVLWLDNYDKVSPNILAVSLDRKFTKHIPPKPWTVDGTHVKVKYFKMEDNITVFELDTTDLKGGFQDLLLWQQLTDEARCALNQMSWGNRRMPINENNFRTTLEEAYPSK
ncbi:hypothetical protein KXD40_004672 [Peronospora effusa]|uniref:Necrosis inducing-like protein NPP1 type n=1 Tax=Peronospora effusa TaxID=542832 RepID=A0A425C209_9STRA|nr:hypothetical protein DD237_008524 [Peronospora effusa]UIZ27813.1 hypothetical protein KXD40_004672 [Peronospora effusa]